MEVKVEMELERETKGSVLYRTASYGELVQNVYVKKGAFEGKIPDKVIVTVTW